mmetsp:Transcript_3157/g.6879  ORF Transcript_3157/g.6879 Transcript_3157/m.6879 type:complete len:366 (+) Transcript_3157:45-1142(+)
MVTKKQRRASAQAKRKRTMALKAAKAWKELSEEQHRMKCPRYGHAVCSVGSRIYVIGGCKGHTARDRLGTVEMFDAAHTENGWTELSNRNLGKREAFGVAVVDGKIYAVGGRQNGGRSDTVAVFDTTQPSKGWKKLPHTLNKARSMHGVCAVGSKIYVVGGCQQLFGDEGRPEVFDTEQPEQGWRYLSKDLTTKERDGLSLAVVGTKIYALGGYVRGHQWNPSPSVFTPKNTVEVYDASKPEDGWVEFPWMHSARKFFGVAVIGTKIYAVGGFTGYRARPYVEVYDTAQHPTGEWTIIEEMQNDREQFGVAVVGEKIFAVGGCNQEGILGTTMEVKDTSIGAQTESDVFGSHEGHKRCRTVEPNN